MAEFEAIGKALQIDDKVLKKLDNVDAKINKIATDSEKMVTVFQSAISKMGTSSDNLLKKLQVIQSTINKLDVSKFAQSVQNVGRGATQVEQFANAIAKAAAAINKYNAENRKRSDVDNSKQIAQLNKEIEAMRKRTQQLEEYINKQREANQGGGRRGGGSSSTTNSDTKALNAYNRAMAASEALVTQRINKIAKLRQAEEMLRNASGNYATQLNRISQEIARLNRLNEGQVDSYGRVIRSQRNLVNTSQQLTRQLALLFSVSQIEGYISKLVQVRGEFELQNTALASILQNKDQADRLFAQITELAVKSPFTVKELTTYTKSLSAYQVEYEKLYSTTKMLADVSAGLGVDMQRLILAFGQVKAANFLRGTEVRQFTEAGLNILGELAKYYSELEGRMISVGQVQEMVTKRMVSFGDVEEVFKRVTSAGGIFYNMQEKQAETLAGMMSNLQDKVDLMLNEIGQNNQETIKGVISFIGDLLENYDAVVTAIQSAGAAFVLYRLKVLASNKALIQFALQQNIVSNGMTKQLSLIQLLRVGFQKFTTAIKGAGSAMKSFVSSNIYLLALSAIVTAIYEAVHWNDEYKESLSEINKDFNEQAASLIRLSNAYDKLAKKAKEASTAQEANDVYKEQFAQLQQLSDTLEDRGYRLPIHIALVTPENIDEAFAGGKEMLELANEFSAEFQKALASETTAAEGWFGMFGENLATDLKDLSDAYSNVGGAFKANLDILDNAITKSSTQFTGLAIKYYDELREGQKANENDYEWTMRRLGLIGRINTITGVLNDAQKDGIDYQKISYNLHKITFDITNKEREAEYELNKVFEDLIDNYGGLDNLKKAYNDNPIIIKTEIDRAFEKLELDAQTKRFAAHMAANRLQIPLELEPPKEMPTFFNDWRDTVKTLDTPGIFEKQLASMADLPDLEKALQRTYKESTEKLEVFNKANTKRLDLTKQIQAESSKLLSQDADERTAAELRIKNLQEQRALIDDTIKKGQEQANLAINTVKTIASAFNLSYIPSEKGKKTALDDLKEQLKIIKQVEEAYRKYREYMTKEEASVMAKDLAVGTSAEKIVGTLSLDTSELIAGLEMFSQEAFKRAGSAGQKAVEDVIRGYKEKVVIDLEVQGIEDAQQRVRDIFSDYEFSLDLKTKGIDPNAFKDMLKAVGASDEEISMLGLDTTTFEEAQKKLRDEIASLQAERGEKQIDAAKKIQEQLTALEIKEAKNRYSQLLTLQQKYQVTEAKIGVLEAQKSTWESELQEMEIGAKEYNAQQKELLELQIQNADDMILELRSEALQLTDFWETLFGDLGEISINSIREILRQRDEIIDNIDKNKPITNNQGETIGYTSSFIDAKGTKQEVQMTIGQYNQLIKSYKNLKNEYRQRNPLGNFIDTVKEGRQEGEDFRDYLTRLSTDFESLANEAFSVADSIMSLTNASEESQQMMQGVQDVVGGTLNAVQGFASGNPLAVIGGLATAIGGIFKIGDARKEKSIQRQLDLVDQLAKKYEDLEEAIDSAYSIDTLNKSMEQAEANIKAQNDALREAIEAERDKKKTDEDRIKEWEEQIEENNERLKELEEQRIADLGGFGSDANMKSAAQAFAEAWLDAFSQTGDGLEALEEKWDEYINNIVAQQLMLRGMEKFLQPAFDLIDKQLEDSRWTGSEQRELDDLIKETMPQLNEYWKSIANSLGVQAGGVGQDELTGLQKGIQGITAEQSDALQSLLESIRFFVSDENTTLHGIYNFLIAPPVESPFMQQLTLQSQRLGMIYDLWNSVIKSVPSSGKAVKVQIV